MCTQRRSKRQRVTRVGLAWILLCKRMIKRNAKHTDVEVRNWASLEVEGRIFHFAYVY